MRGDGPPLAPVQKRRPMDVPCDMHQLRCPALRLHCPPPHIGLPQRSVYGVALHVEVGVQKCIDILTGDALMMESREADLRSETGSSNPRRLAPRRRGTDYVGDLYAVIFPDLRWTLCSTFHSLRCGAGASGWWRTGVACWAREAGCGCSAGRGGGDGTADARSGSA